jgi:hypothetical protein
VWSAQRIFTAINLGFLDRSRHFAIHLDLHLSSRGSVATFQTYYFSENLVAPGIDPETTGSVARNSDHWNTERPLSDMMMN